MAEQSSDMLAQIDLKEKPLKKISISKELDHLKGSVMASSTIFFKLECRKWDEFVQLLERIHRVDFVSKSPSMPIAVNCKVIEEREKEECVDTIFTALSGLSYPTLISHYIKKTTIDMIVQKKQYLEDCGYVVITGKLSFFKEGGN